MPEEFSTEIAPGPEPPERAPRRSAGRLSSSFLGFLWVVCFVLTADGLLHELWDMTRQPFNIYLLAAAVAVLLFLIAFLGLLRASATMEPHALRRLGLLILLAGFVARLAWVLVFDSYQTSDCGDYLTCGREIVEGVISRCPAPVHWQRGLMIAAPVIALFGLKLGAIEGANLLVYLASGGAFLVLVRHLVGLRWGVLGLAFFVTAPELFYPVTLASHDLHGMLWLLVFLLLGHHLGTASMAFDRTPRKLAKTLALSAGLGLALAGLELSRSYGTPAALALCLWMVYLITSGKSSTSSRAAGTSRLLIFLLLLPLTAQGAVERHLARVFNRPPEVPAYTNLAWVSGVNIRTANTYPDQVLWKKLEYPLLAAAGRTDFAWGKMGNEWSNDLFTSLTHVVKKNHVLAMSGGNRVFATAPRPASGDRDPMVDLVRRTNHRGFQLQDRVIRLLNILMLGLMLGRLLLVRHHPLKATELLLLTFCLLSYLLLLLLGETQPRYDIFLLIPGSYMSAQVLGWVVERGTRRGHDLPAGGWSPVVAGLGLLLLLGVLAAAGLKGAAAAGYALSDMGSARIMADVEVLGVYPGARPAPARADVAFNEAGVGFQSDFGSLPAGSAAGVALDLPLPPGGVAGQTQLEGFFVTGPGSLTHRETMAGLSLEACLLVEGWPDVCYPVGEAEARFLQLRVTDTNRDGVLAIRAMVKALTPVDSTMIPAQPLAVLEHLRLR